MSMSNNHADDPRVTLYKVVIHPESTTHEVSIYCPYCGQTWDEQAIYGGTERAER